MQVFLDHIALNVSDVDLMLEFYIKITEGPVSRWGAHGTETSVYFNDPE